MGFGAIPPGNFSLYATGPINVEIISKQTAQKKYPKCPVPDALQYLEDGDALGSGFPWLIVQQHGKGICWVCLF